NHHCFPTLRSSDLSSVNLFSVEPGNSGPLPKVGDRAKLSKKKSEKHKITMDHYLIPSFSPINSPCMPPISGMDWDGRVAFKLTWAAHLSMLKRDKDRRRMFISKLYYRPF